MESDTVHNCLREFTFTEVHFRMLLHEPKKKIREN